MKKIIEHQDGTYSLTHLTFDELHYLASACQELINERRVREEKGKKLNDFSVESWKFADELGDMILDITTK